MSDIYHPSDYVVENSHIPSMEKYKDLYKKSLNDPEKFWSDIVQEFYWNVAPKEGNFLTYNFDVRKGKIFVNCLDGSETNVCFNLLDRNVRNGNGDKVAFYW
ncbi:hypothetical protein O3G_MSEX000896 [Manduca sexta]|nr:hypothetical protein O3G_MSEX000896 [Manduca sexta]